MENIDTIEAFILEEIKAVNEDTFMFNLHEKNLFHKNRFDLLLEKSRYLIAYYRSEQKTENSIAIAKGLIALFEHTIFLLYCNFEPSDLYKISNYSKDLSTDIISDYYTEIRKLSDGIIQCLESEE